MLENADNRYDWSADGQLTKRTPKAGGVAWSFVSSFRARTNQMRLDAALGSDGTTIGFVYDPFGRLVSPQWPAPRGNEELYYDGPDVVLARRRLDGGDQWVRYVHGPLDDQPLATEVYAQGAAPTPGTGSQFYYHADGEGSIRLITNAGSTVFNRYDYDSFGRRLAVVESLPLQPDGWKGREWIAGPDIYYNRARFYDPALGRFLAEDPLGFGGGDFNLYSFAWNNPRRWNDPSGLSATEFGLLSRVTPVAEAAAIGCAISTTLSGLAAWLSGDGTYEVVGLQLASPCIVSPVLARRPGGRGGAGVGSGAGEVGAARGRMTMMTVIHARRHGKAKTAIASCSIRKARSVKRRAGEAAWNVRGSET